MHRSRLAYCLNRLVFRGHTMPSMPFAASSTSTRSRSSETLSSLTAAVATASYGQSTVKLVYSSPSLF